MKATFDRFFAASTGKFAAERMVEIMLAQLTAAGMANSEQRPQKFKPWRFRSRFQKTIFPNSPVEVLESRLNEMAKCLNFKIRPKMRKCGQGLYHVTAGAPSESSLRLPAYNSLLGEIF
jgi:hypothetical protein